MKISDLIKILQDDLKLYGDLEIEFTYCPENREPWYWSFNCKELEQKYFTIVDGNKLEFRFVNKEENVNENR